jgi:hypothetical protein
VTQKHESGYTYNLVLGERNYLIQRNWDPILQKCSMSADDELAAADDEFGDFMDLNK